MRVEQDEAINSEEFNEEEEGPLFEDAQSEIDDLDGLKNFGSHREVSFNPGFRAASNYEREYKMQLASAAKTNSLGRTRNVENFNKKGSSLLSEKIDRGLRPNEEHLRLQKSSLLTSEYATNHIFPKLELANTGKYAYNLPQVQSYGFITLEQEEKGKIYNNRRNYVVKNKIASTRDEGNNPQVHNFDYQTSKNHPQSVRVVSSAVAKEEPYRTIHGTSNTERFSTIHSDESRSTYSQKNLAGEFAHNILEKYERNGNPVRLSNVSTEQPSNNSKLSYNSGKKSLINTMLEAKVNQITAKILQERELEGTGQGKDVPLSTNLTASPIISRHDPYSSSSFNSIGLGAPTSETGGNEGGNVSKTRIRSEGEAFKNRNLDLSPENKSSSQAVKDPNYDVHFEFSSQMKPDIHQVNNGANDANANNIQRKKSPAKIRTGFREKFCPRKKSKRSSSKDSTPKPNVTTNTERGEVVTINSHNPKKRTLKAYRPLLVCLCAIAYYLLFLIYRDTKR